MTRRAVISGLLIAACLSVSACDGVITADLERAWQTKHRSVIIPKFTDFRGLDVSVDVGVDIFSYRLPEDVTAAEAVRRIEEQVRTLEPCYQVVVSKGPDELRLRCPTETFGYHGFEEYLVHVNPSTRRATIMWGNFDSDVEVNQQYQYFQASFWEKVKRQ